MTLQSVNFGWQFFARTLDILNWLLLDLLWEQAFEPKQNGGYIKNRCLPCWCETLIGDGTVFPPLAYPLTTSWPFSAKVILLIQQPAFGGGEKGDCMKSGIAA